jgi:hypothetical protein
MAGPLDPLDPEADGDARHHEGELRRHAGWQAKALPEGTDQECEQQTELDGDDASLQQRVVGCRYLHGEPLVVRAGLCADADGSTITVIALAQEEAENC